MRGFFWGSTVILGKEMEFNDVRGVTAREPFGMDATTYGGRVSNIGGTDMPGVYVVLQKNRVIDVYIPDLTACNKTVIVEYAEKKGVEIPRNATKNSILELLGYNIPEESGIPKTEEKETEEPIPAKSEADTKK